MVEDLPNFVEAMATVSDVQFGIVFTQYSRLITTVYSITKATAKAKPNTTTDYSREEVKASPSLSLSFCWFATASKKAAEGLSFPHMPTHPTLFVPPPPSLHRCLRLRSRTSHRTTTMAYVRRPRPRPFLKAADAFLLLFSCCFALLLLPPSISD